MGSETDAAQRFVDSGNSGHLSPSGSYEAKVSVSGGAPQDGAKFLFIWPRQWWSSDKKFLIYLKCVWKSIYWVVELDSIMAVPNSLNSGSLKICLLPLSSNEALHTSQSSYVRLTQQPKTEEKSFDFNFQ